MEITAEQAHLIATKIARAVDKLADGTGTTAVLDIHGQAGTVLAVVLTTNSVLIPKLLEWARTNDDIGTLAEREETRPNGT